MSKKLFQDPDIYCYAIIILNGEDEKTILIFTCNGLHNNQRHKFINIENNFILVNVALLIWWIVPWKKLLSSTFLFKVHFIVKFPEEPELFANKLQSIYSITGCDFRAKTHTSRGLKKKKFTSPQWLVSHMMEFRPTQSGRTLLIRRNFNSGVWKWIWW